MLAPYLINWGCNLMWFITVKTKFAKVVFSQVSVCPQGGVHGRGCMAGGVRGREACVHGKAGVWQGGHAWHAPPGRYYEIRSMSGLLEYWNTFLFGSLLPMITICEVF